MKCLLLAVLIALTIHPRNTIEVCRVHETLGGTFQLITTNDTYYTVDAMTSRWQPIKGRATIEGDVITDANYTTFPIVGSGLARVDDQC